MDRRQAPIIFPRPCLEAPALSSKHSWHCLLYTSLDGASFSQLPPEALESALEILASLMAQLAGEEVAVSLLISRAAGWPEQFAACRHRRELSAPLLLLAAADPSAALTEEEILARLPGLSSTFLVCGDVRRLEAGTCTLLARHHVPLLAWGQPVSYTHLDVYKSQDSGLSLQ